MRRRELLCWCYGPNVRDRKGKRFRSRHRGRVGLGMVLVCDVGVDLFFLHGAATTHWHMASASRVPKLPTKICRKKKRRKKTPQKRTSSQPPTLHPTSETRPHQTWRQRPRQQSQGQRDLSNQNAIVLLQPTHRHLLVQRRARLSTRKGPKASRATTLSPLVAHKPGSHASRSRLRRAEGAATSRGAAQRQSGRRTTATTPVAMKRRMTTFVPRQHSH